MGVPELLDLIFFHWTPDRAIWLGDRTLSWDARCSGIHAGFGIGVLFHALLDRRASHLPPWPLLGTVAVLFVPLFVDVLTIAHGLRPPSNEVRFLTGVLFGQALGALVYPAFIRLSTHEIRKQATLSSASRLATYVGLGMAATAALRIDSAWTYASLQLLGILGNMSLILMIAYGVYRLFRDSASQPMPRQARIEKTEG
jgi:uncharacterized membrane protein